MKRDPTGISLGLGAAMHRSAVVRTWGILGAAIGALIIVILRLITEGFIYDGTMLTLVWMTIAFESFMLFKLRRSDRTLAPDRTLAIVQTLYECSLPTTLLVVLWVYGRIVPPPLLVMPATVCYSVFLMLTVLHLRPWLTGLAGAYCALQHGTLVAIAFVRGDLADSLLGAAVISTYPVVLAFVGATGWFVTLWVRADVDEAVNEAQRRAEFEGELVAAGTVQQGILPKRPPDLRGWTVAGWTRPAEQTGGDYWDWTALPDGRLAVSIGDVAGHGVGPAIITAYCHAYARGCFVAGMNMTDALKRIATLIRDEIPPDRFITYAVVALTPNVGHAVLRSAGHAPNLVVRAASGEVEQHDANAYPIGFGPEIEFDDVDDLALEPGDSIVLLTDGFYEWVRPGGGQWGIARLLASASRHRHAEPAEMIAAILADVEAFAAGAAQEDDLTMVVMRREPT
ncbi:MAG: PP2C family protein-serine/threonine phosphatase [Planctomycetota bacterium]